MRSSVYKVLLMSSVMIFSSLAGCLGGDSSDEDDSSNTSVNQLGKVLVSTYHVEQLVSAVAGDLVEVNMIAPSSIPVHDYEPTNQDLSKFNDVELFFYHGLNLEPWVDKTLSTLGSDAPKAVQTHKMPTGYSDLDFKTLLTDKLCELLSSDSSDNKITLHGAEEIHAEYEAYHLAFPEVSPEDLREHDHEEHDHEGHDHANETRDDHEGHDHANETRDDHEEHDHEEHDFLEAEDKISNPAGCNSGTSVSIYHLEAGEYVLEFSDNDNQDFNLAVLPMPGAHHHHHGPFEWAGAFNVSDTSHTWTMAKVDGGYADPSMKVVLFSADSPDAETIETLEGGVEALMEGDCPVIQDGETMTSIASTGSCFEWTVNQNSDVTSFKLDTTGMTGFVAFTAHSPYEFEAAEHYLKDSAGNNVEHTAEEGGGGHGHGDHGEESHVCHDETTHENHDEYTTKEDCETAGHMWMEITGQGVCHDTTTHENHDEYTTEEDCENAGHEWMEAEHEMTAEHALEDFDMNNDSKLSLNEIMEAWEDEHHDERDHEGHDHSNESSDTHEEHDHSNESSDTHEGHDHGDEEENHDDYEEVMIREAFNHSDADNDGFLSLEELKVFIFLVDDRGTSVIIHIEEEGDYGFALPDKVNMTIEGMSGGHDDHEGHDHGGESNEVSDDSDTQSEIVAGDDEDAFEYDPHSWLNPLAFKAQIDVVLENLTSAFPEGKDTFKSNADAYKSELMSIDSDFESAFGSSGTCTDKTIIANHNAYSYMAYRYDLNFLTIHGLDPEGEPSPEDIIKVVEEIKEKGLTVIFVEEYTNNASLDSLRQETVSSSMPDGIQIKTLYTMEMPPKDDNDNYLTLMQKNLESLKSGLACS